MTAAQETLRLTTTPETVEWPETHYVFIEKDGPFMSSAPAAWTELHAARPEIEKHNTITRYFSAYKVGPQIYRAGVAVSETPSDLPDGVRYEVLPGGKFASFTLTGPFRHLPEATSRAVRMMEESGLALRDAFNIEQYVTDPRVTPEEELRTDILFPLA